MKKYTAFALLICILVLGVAAVLAVKYPELQEVFAAGGKSAYTGTVGFIKRLVEAFRIAFSK